MKKKYKVKEKYASGVNGINTMGTYVEEPITPVKFNGTSGAEKGVQGGISGVASAIPVANIFAGIGKGARKMVRNDDEYGIASSDAAAAGAAVFSPSKSTIKNLSDGRYGDAITSLILPFGSAARDNKRQRAERDEYIKQQQAIQNSRAFGGADASLNQATQIYKSGTSGVKTKPSYRLGGKDYDESTLLKNFTPQNSFPKGDPRLGADYVYNLALESSNHPEDIEFRNKGYEADETAGNLVNTNDILKQDWKKKAFIANMQLQNSVAPTTVATDSTRVMKPKYIYKTGTGATATEKLVEAEGGEYIFKKVGNKYKLKHDLDGGKSHKQGGEPVVVEQGDVITPKADRKRVSKMIDKNGYTSNKFNGYRLSLPKDQDIAANGTDLEKINARGQTGVMPQFNINPQVNANPNAPIDNSGASTGSKWGSYLTTAAQLAPAVYNLGQGLFGNTAQEQGNYLTPELLQYQDMSDPLRTRSRQAYRVNADNARNLSGGNAGNVRANLAQASAEDFQRQQAINNEEVARSQQIQNANTGLRNQYRAMNAAEKARVSEINNLNESKRSEYLGKGLEGIQDFANSRAQDKATRDQNELLASTLEKPNYKWDNDKQRWISKAESKKKS